MSDALQKDCGSTGGRLLWLDIARTAALVGMVVFHFFHDLEIFGILPRGTTVTGGWDVFSSLVAGSFLFIAGISFWLAHGDGVRWRSFVRRLIVLCLAAALVSLATWVVFPDNFIRFGILHCIALSGVLGLICLRLPGVVNAGLAIVFVMAPDHLRSDLFNADLLLWTGLATVTPPALDYIPVMPWSGWFLAGLAAAQMLRPGRLRPAIALSRRYPKGAAFLAWPGRHSLTIYLLHQPVLLGLIWTGVKFAS
ncbi:heparan-alpha-glucosaminide N-acetyltransferase [Roseobacter sp.]|uniref:heparan-alpha-glucosaminide N-acetyltransferase n=1 Tax=Roseobacter sp. TaxID=1907202 RepID=UPI0025FC973C|nr:heparan-alpha-glucosaminide N-acetyltransferase [Roseobacter sp.]